MKATVQSSGEKLFITIDRSEIDDDTLIAVLRLLRVEELIQKGGQTETVLEVSEKITADWWNRNKDRFIEGSAE